jgi:hypothetical protein
VHKEGGAERSTRRRSLGEIPRYLQEIQARGSQRQTPNSNPPEGSAGLGFEEGSEGQHRAKYVPGNSRNGDTDFLISELICFRTSDFKDCSLIHELDVRAS